MFCKIFDSEKHGQILVVLDGNDDGKPTVTFSMEPKELGVCSIGSAFEDTEDGWNKAETMLEKSDQELAEKFAESILSTIYPNDTE